jgi:hypothetical protein
MKPLVILTGTVTPSSGTPLALLDPSERRQQYAAAIRWWSMEGLRRDFDVLFAENSGDNLSSWLPPETKALACPTPVQPELGKGAGEVSILRSAMTSDLIAAAQRPWIAKCTGRLTLANPSAVLPARGHTRPFLSCRTNQDLSEVDARFVVATPTVWLDHLLGYTEELDDRAGRFLEHAFAKGLCSALLADVAFVPFKRVPKYRGASGTSGLRYDSTKLRIAGVLEDGANAARSWGRRRA